MSKLKDKIKSWLVADQGAEKKEESSFQKDPSSLDSPPVPTELNSVQDKPLSIDSGKNVNRVDSPEMSFIPLKEENEWELRQSDLAKRQEEAQGKLFQLAQELANTRKNFQEDLRKKEEERIKLLAQLSLSDHYSQDLLSQQQEDFSKFKKEAQKEIEVLEKRLQEESASWSKELYELEKNHEEFLVSSEFHLQEKALEKKRREEELKKTIAEVQNQIAKINSKIESEQKEGRERNKSLEDTIISLRSQLQLKESNRRIKEEKLQQDLSQARSEWEFKIHALEVQLEQKRGEWQEELTIKESEFKALKMEKERREVALKVVLKKREEEIGTVQEQAVAKLAVLEAEAQRAKIQNESDLKVRQEQIEKLRVELMLLDSQLKVDAEKSNDFLLSMQKEAIGKIAFLEKKVQEETQIGKKAIESKQAEIQSLEVQFSIKRKRMEEEFSQKKLEMERQHQELQEKLAELSRTIEKEREEESLKLQKFDAIIFALKQEMGSRSQEVKNKQEQFATQLDSKREEMAQQLSHLGERCKLERGSLLESLNQQGRVLSEKKSALAREEAALQHALKKQEEQLLFENQLLENQILNLKNRLQQEQTSHSKVLEAKEGIVRNLKSQTLAQEESVSNELKQFEVKLKEEENRCSEKLNRFQKEWSEEKVQLEQSLAQSQNESKEIERKISQMPSWFEAEQSKRLLQHDVEMQKLKSLLETTEQQMVQETEQFKRTFNDYENQQNELNRSLGLLAEKLEEEKKEHERKLEVEQSRWKDQLDRSQLEIKEEKDRLELMVETAEKENGNLASELSNQQSLYQGRRDEVEKKWNLEQKGLENQVTSLNADLDVQRSIWQKALLERSAQIQELKSQIERSKEQQELELVQLAERRKTVEEEFKRIVCELENQRADVQAEFSQKQQGKKDEKERLEKSLDEFLMQSEKNLAARREEILQKSLEMKNQQNSLQKKLESETQGFSEILSKKDLEISSLKNNLSLEEVTFRAEWGRGERDFEAFKKTTTEKVQELQSSIFAENQLVEEHLSKLDQEIKSLEDRRIEEAETERRVFAQIEEEFFKTQSVLGLESTELEKKIIQERDRYKQQLKVKEMEVDSLQRKLKQREIQRGLIKRSRQDEISQERNHILDQKNELQKQLEEERGVAERILQSKQQELDLLKEKMELQKERIQSERSKRQQEMLKARTRLEGQIKELSQRLDEEISGYELVRRNKDQELEQVSNRLKLWDETVKLEEEQDRLKWENEHLSLEKEIQELEFKLKEGKSELDQLIQQRSEEVLHLTEELNRLGQNHAIQLGALQKQKSEILAEEERWEKKLKEEKTRMKEEIRILDREMERLKLQISLKETQISIDQQKKERENKWARRPLESKVAELKHLWEEKEKEKRRKIDLYETERENCLAEIKRTCESTQKELNERCSALSQLKEKIEMRLKEIREQFGQETNPTLFSLQQKQQEIGKLKDLCQKLEDFSGKVSDESYSLDLDELNQEIALWEKKLREAGEYSEEDKKKLEEGKSSIERLKQELAEKKKNLEKEKVQSAKIFEKLKEESNRFSEDMIKADALSNRWREQSSQSRIYLECGIAAFKVGNDPEALFCFDQALSLDPHSAICYEMKGLIYEKQGNKELALESFAKALELNSQNDLIRKHIQELQK